jgi:hypothetical protein
MTAIRYLDLDLAIEPIEPESVRYRARVLSSPVGQASAEFELPFCELELENFLLRLSRPRRGVRRIDSPEMTAATTFGGRLFAAVFTDQVQQCFGRSLDAARHQQAGLRLRLRVSGPLADLPWEYLFDPQSKRFLSYSTTTPIVRYLDLPYQIAPLAVQPPLNVLIMIASPRDHAVLDVEGEWRKVEVALSDLVHRGLVTLTRLEQATLPVLQRQLRRNNYHVFHFIGHGGFDNQTESGVLLLEDERGLSRRVSGHQLGALLYDHQSLRLALLNACEGARTMRNDPFAGVAQNSVQQGIPAVIAMQFEITDEAAVTLAHEFYGALADGYPVDAALAEARKAIFAQGNDIEWGTPVLFLRAPDGQIFDVAAPSPAVLAEAAAPQLSNAERRAGDELEIQSKSQDPVSSPIPERLTLATKPPNRGWPWRLVGGFALLLLLAALWQGPRLFNALLPGVQGPAMSITPATVVAPAADHAATSSRVVTLPDTSTPATVPTATAADALAPSTTAPDEEVEQPDEAEQVASTAAPIPSPPPTPDFARLVQQFRLAEQAALKTLSPAVMEQLPIFAQGEALVDLQERVEMLQAAGYYQNLTVESIQVQQVTPDLPAGLLVSECHHLQTYAHTTEGDRLLDEQRAELVVVYGLIHHEGSWKVEKVRIIVGDRDINR